MLHFSHRHCARNSTTHSFGSIPLCQTQHRRTIHTLSTTPLSRLPPRRHQLSPTATPCQHTRPTRRAPPTLPPAVNLQPLTLGLINKIKTRGLRIVNRTAAIAAAQLIAVGSQIFCNYFQFIKLKLLHPSTARRLIFGGLFLRRPWLKPYGLRRNA